MSNNFLPTELNVMEYFLFLKKLSDKKRLMKSGKPHFVDNIYKRLKAIWSNTIIPTIDKYEIKKKI